MVKRDRSFSRYESDYLFLKIQKEKERVGGDIINLGVGDTTAPIPKPITSAMKQAAHLLGMQKSYSGYEPAFGRKLLREKIAETFYQGTISPEEIFISDGAKSDIGRLQLLFGPETTITVQDPSYPAYIAASRISGKEKISYFSCTPKNNFFPESVPKADLIYFCSPNNPTGAVATRSQLERLVAIAKAHKAFIIFDSAYSGFIQDAAIPRSIYEISGAKDVAIEVGSFSKWVGFTGVRLGWSVVPKTLKYEEGGSVHDDWARIVSTFFNSASNLAQIGGIAALEKEAISQARKQIQAYLDRAKILRNTFEKKGYCCYGGLHSPYVWVDLKGRDSWEMFQYLLEKAKIATIPGSGFGPAGEGFLRLSAFGRKEEISEAKKRLNQVL